MKSTKTEQQLKAETQAKTQGMEEQEPQPDLSQWIGQRNFVTDDCEEVASEEGYELTADIWNDYEETMDKVPTATTLLRGCVTRKPATTRSPKSGIVELTSWTTARGRLQIFDWSGAELLDPDATFDGWTLRYAYDHNPRLSMRGVVEYPELSPQ